MINIIKEKLLMTKRFNPIIKNMVNGPDCFFGWMSVRIGIWRKFPGELDMGY
jgi:hypothetical protein